ncbi:MAG: hypothetical protein CMB97_05095 [Flavobacteriaceae bacterium]|nr:hypothetical protein [Flavobacteriaceae bacterium]
MLRVTKKEGPNTGREFYNCAFSRCKFFQWKESQSVWNAKR